MPVTNVIETDAVLALINLESHVKCDLPQFFICILNIFDYFYFNFFMSESREVRNKQKLHDKYNNIRKKKPAENYTWITFAASY